jgi:hypothetical protein
MLINTPLLPKNTTPTYKTNIKQPNPVWEVGTSKHKEGGIIHWNAWSLELLTPILFFN